MPRSRLIREAHGRYLPLDLHRQDRHSKGNRPHHRNHVGPYAYLSIVSPSAVVIQPTRYVVSYFEDFSGRGVSAGKIDVLLLAT